MTLELIGRVIDDEFKIARLVGAGAYGSVYEAEELKLKRRVAVKTLNPDMASGRNLERFLREAQHLARLNHENVVHINRLGEIDGTPYIVMEFIEGKTLARVLEGPALPVRRVIEVLGQVCHGLQAIHSIDIVHRDLSRNNIMLTEAGTVKLLDLGLAKDVGPAGAAPTDQYLAGTVAYIAPEVVGGKHATPTSDVFSFGVVAYELISGENPFNAEHPMTVLNNVLHRDPPPLQERVTNCPLELARIVQKCLEKSPGDRPQNLNEVSQVIEGLLAAPEDATITLGATNLSSISKRKSSAPQNPYLNRVMIKKRQDFIGRTQEVRRIYARLNATPPGSVSLVGDRKIGKSSLLNYIYLRQNQMQYLEQPDRMVMVFLDLQQQRDMTIEGFVSTLLNMAELELRGRLDISGCSPDLDGVHKMVQILEKNGYRICIMLDEFEAITANSNFNLEFFSFLRYLANHYNVAYLTSSAHDLQALCHTQEISDSPFFNIFSSLRLSGFRRPEAEELISVPSERVGRPLGKFVDEILGIGGLFPFFLQIACCHSIEYLDDNPEAAEPDFNDVRRRFYEEASLHYKYMWTTFGPHERSAMLRVAEGKSIPDSLRHVLAELARRNYVADCDSEPKLFSETFLEFVKSRHEKKSFLGRLLRRS